MKILMSSLLGVIFLSSCSQNNPNSSLIVSQEFIYEIEFALTAECHSYKPIFCDD